MWYIKRGQLTNRYVSRIIADVLGEDQRLLSIAYRKMKHLFMEEGGIKKINEHLAEKKGDVTSKKLSISMDMSARSRWETSITAHLDDIPFDSIGKGEQCRVQMKLAIEATDDSSILLIEEPENHLSHSNMSRLIEEITQRGAKRQIVVATHSNFVLNKLGIDNVKLLSRNANPIIIDNLSADTKEFFMKLPGYDTLRLILSAKTILVEGPSDELIVQKAYKTRHGKLPLDDGVDVISAGMSFKRFLEIGKLLKLNIRIVTDNDGKINELEDKYKDYLDKNKLENILICYDKDENCPTLEPQLLKANSLKVLNEVLGTEFNNKADLLAYMGKNKTDSALKMFNFKGNLIFPEYINNAVQ